MGRGSILTAYRRIGAPAYRRAVPRGPNDGSDSTDLVEVLARNDCARVSTFSARKPCSARSKIFIVSASKITISSVGATSNRDSIGVDEKAHRRYTPTPRCAHTPIRPHSPTPTRSQAGVSLVEMSIALFLLTTVAVFGFQTIMAGWLLQNSAIMQSMTDAYAGIETACAQRRTFAGPNGIL